MESSYGGREGAPATTLENRSSYANPAVAIQNLLRKIQKPQWLCKNPVVI